MFSFTFPGWPSGSKKSSTSPHLSGFIWVMETLALRILFQKLSMVGESGKIHDIPITAIGSKAPCFVPCNSSVLFDSGIISLHQSIAYSGTMVTEYPAST